MGLFDKLLKKEVPETMLTDDERELREYEENEYTPESRLEETAYAEFIVEDSFAVAGRGLVVTGTVTGGTFRVGDRVQIENSMTGKTLDSEITGIELFRKMTDSVSEGAHAGFLLKDLHRDQIKRNDIVKKL